MTADRHGLKLTAANEAAVAHYEATLSAYLGLRRDTGDHLRATFAADPDMVMAHCTRGYFMQLFANPALGLKAGESLVAARQAAESAGAEARERLHIEALGAWCAGDLYEATNLWEEILLDHPRDVLALMGAHLQLPPPRAKLQPGPRLQQLALVRLRPQPANQG